MEWPAARKHHRSRPILPTTKQKSIDVMPPAVTAGCKVSIVIKGGLWQVIEVAVTDTVHPAVTAGWKVSIVVKGGLRQVVEVAVAERAPPMVRLLLAGAGGALQPRMNSLLADVLFSLAKVRPRLSPLFVVALSISSLDRLADRLIVLIARLLKQPCAFSCWAIDERCPHISLYVRTQASAGQWWACTDIT